MDDPRPTAAGMYDFYLGGTANSPADRTAAEQIAKLIPEIGDAAWANRGFLQRAVTRLAGQWGVRQFLDIGAGLPTRRNTHEVVADVRPDGRVVYVDVDRSAAARGSELLADVPGAVMIHADIREPDRILDHPQTRRLIDLTEPVGLLIVAVLQFVPDDDEPWRLVGRYLDALAPGSYLVLSHGSGEHASEQLRQTATRIYANTPTPPTDRSRTEIERFFRGLEIVPPYPGAPPELTFAGLWGAEDPDAADSDGSRLSYAAVGRKP
ncbi:MAG: SAM-dependent methyltransferase [Natronosporangium sp.]